MYVKLPSAYNIKMTEKNIVGCMLLLVDTTWSAVQIWSSKIVGHKWNFLPTISKPDSETALSLRATLHLT